MLNKKVVVRFWAVIVVVLLGLAMWSSRTHAASVGDPFLRGVTTPAELAAKVQSSLAGNPKGTSIIDLKRCKRDRSCATPANYLEMFQQADPGARLTEVGQLPGYLLSLQISQGVPADEYWLACLKPKGKGYEAILHCVARHFKKGEKAWVNPKTGRIVLASDCTNPVEGSVAELTKPKQMVAPPPSVPVQQVVVQPAAPAPAVSDCGEIRFPTRGGEPAVRTVVFGPDGADLANDACIRKNDSLRNCDAGELCNFSRTQKVIGGKTLLVRSYPTTPGEHVLYVPRAFLEDKGYMTCLVLVRGDDILPPLKDALAPAAIEHNKAVAGWMHEHYSDAICVGYFGYSFKGVATVYHSKAEMPSDVRIQMYFPDVGTSLYE